MCLFILHYEWFCAGSRGCSCLLLSSLPPQPIWRFAEATADGPVGDADVLVPLLPHRLHPATRCQHGMKSQCLCQHEGIFCLAHRSCLYFLSVKKAPSRHEFVCLFYKMRLSCVFVYAALAFTILPVPLLCVSCLYELCSSLRPSTSSVSLTIQITPLLYLELDMLSRQKQGKQQHHF